MHIPGGSLIKPEKCNIAVVPACQVTLNFLNQLHQSVPFIILHHPSNFQNQSP